jgi:hypothetical protein
MTGPVLVPGTRTWDPLSNLKGRIGEGFVETILREAGYKVCRLGRESQFPHMLKTKSDELFPDFLVWKSLDLLNKPTVSHRFLSIEVKFRAKRDSFLHPSEVDPLLQQADQWPDLYVVLVTDRPREGRSCFQVLQLRDPDPDTPLEAIDLHDVSALGIDKTIINKYETLARNVFGPLTSPQTDSYYPRKPPTKASNNDGVSAAGYVPRTRQS